MMVDQRITLWQSSPWRRAASLTGKLARFGMLFVCSGVIISPTIPVCDADDETARQDAKGKSMDASVNPKATSGSGAEILSQGSYAERQQATLDLWRSRDVTRDEVQDATRDPDPEVAQRAKWILRQWQRGALPDNTADISRFLR